MVFVVASPFVQKIMGDSRGLVDGAASTKFDLRQMWMEETKENPARTTGFLSAPGCCGQWIS